VGIGVVAFWPGEKEPEDNGHKLSLLLDAIDDHGEATLAVRRIGTNALPFLLRWISKERSPARQRMIWIAEKLHVPIRGFALGIALDDDNRRRGERGFGMLGPIATPALPELARLLSRTNSLTSGAAARALAAIGKEGIPALLDSFNDKGNLNRPIVAYYLVFAYRNAGQIEVGLPTVKRMLDDQDARVVRNVVVALTNLTLEPDHSVPLLAELTQHSNVTVRYVSVSGLEKFGLNSRSAVPRLVERLEDSDSTVREAATNALQKIAPEVLTNGVKGF